MVPLSVEPFSENVVAFESAVILEESLLFLVRIIRYLLFNDVPYLLSQRLGVNYFKVLTIKEHFFSINIHCVFTFVFYAPA